ncbi:MAG: hypothetical protein R3C10_26845 [Pirellulales bacterium]
MNTYDDLMLLATTAPVFVLPDPSAIDPLEDEKEILRDLGIDVLAHDPQSGAVLIYSEASRKTYRKADINRLQRTHLLEMCGVDAKDKIDGEDNYTTGRVREAIALVACYASQSDGQVNGLGCWRAVNEKGHKLDSILVVSGNQAGEVTADGKLVLHDRPRVHGNVLNLGHPQHWCDFDQLKDRLRHAGDHQWGESVIDEAVTLFQKWHWEGKLRPMLLCGLVMATFVQTTLSWRPLVGISGPSHTGKSTLFEVLEGLFGPLSLLSSKVTEAGFRQALGDNANAAMIDEFEKSRYRNQLLELLRTSAKGTKVLRGTASQEGKQFGLRHIVWVASIELGLQAEADRNRFIVLETKRIPDDQVGTLVLPTDEKLAELGQCLLAIAVRYAVEADRLAGQLKAVSRKGFNARTISAMQCQRR